MILTRDQIAKEVQTFFSDKPVRRVWLIGSYARGEADEESDLDVMVDIDYEKLLSGFEYFGWHQDLGERVNKKVDVVSYKWVNKHILPYIKADMKLIYEK
jgi:predicted nucleotidyltransferase